jgi:hypothetical protein
MWASELAGLGVVTGPETEAADSAAAAQALLVLIPDWVLAYGDSPSLSGFVPPEVRRANRHDLLMQKGVGSVKKARTYFAAWLSFAATHNLPRLGLPADGDACMWFLREYAEPGTAARHGAACGLRWLHTHMGLPFDAARQTVRAASRAPLREPSFADMWPVFVLRHFFIIAMTYTGPAAPFVRAYATAMYIAVAASLRLIDGVTQGQPKWGIGKSAQHLRAFPPSIYGVDLVLVGCLSAQPPNPPSFIIGASTSQVETPLREAKAPAYRQFFFV